MNVLSMLANGAVFSAAAIRFVHNSYWGRWQIRRRVSKLRGEPHAPDSTQASTKDLMALGKATEEQTEKAKRLAHFLMLVVTIAFGVQTYGEYMKPNNSSDASSTIGYQLDAQLKEFGHTLDELKSHVEASESKAVELESRVGKIEAALFGPNPKDGGGGSGNGLVLEHEELKNQVNDAIKDYNAILGPILDRQNPKLERTVR